MNLKEKIISLIDKSNETTSKGDPDLTESVKTLCEGYGKGGSDIKYKSKNILADGTVTFGTSGGIVDGMLVITIPARSGAEWLPLIYNIPIDISRSYKLHVEDYVGYGRLGISNAPGTSGSIDQSPFGSGGYRCGNNAKTLHPAPRNVDDWDNHAIKYSDTEDKEFLFVRGESSPTTTTKKVSIWFCTDQKYQDKQDSFTFKIALYESTEFDYEVIPVSGLVPLQLTESTGDMLVSWNVTGDIKQDVGTYTATAMEVTAVGIEDETDYPYFNTSNFENVVVGDEVNFSGDGLSYSMTAKKIEDGNVYFENTGIDDTVTGAVPLTLEDANGEDLKSWSITGNTVQNWEPKPSNEFDKSLWTRSGDSSIFDNNDGTFTIVTVAYQEDKNVYTVPDNTKDYCLSFNMKWDYYSDADRIRFRMTGIKPDGTKEHLKEISYFTGTQKVSLVLPANTYSAFAFGGWAYTGSVIISNIGLNEGTIPYDEFNLSEIKGTGDKTEQLIPFPFLSSLPSKPTFEPKTIKGLTVYVDKRGVIHIDGTSDSDNADIYIFGAWNSTAYNLGVKNLYITCSSNKVEGYVGIYEGTQNAYRFISSYSKTNISDSNFVNFIFLRIAKSGTTFNNEEIRVMASETGFVEFKPYGYEIPVVSKGENYLSSELEIGTLSASEGLPVIMYTRLRTKDFTVLNPGTYIVEATTLNGEDLYGLAFEYDVNTEAFIRRMPEAWTKMPFTFTIDTQRKIKFLVSKTNGGTDKIYPDEIKSTGIINGDTKTSTIYLNSPLMADEVLKSDGSREVEWGKYVLDGVNPISKNISDASDYLYWFDMPDAIGESKDNFLCNYLPSVNAVPTGDSIGIAFRKNARQGVFYINFGSALMNTIGNTRTALQAWLKSKYDTGHPVTVLYQLAEPTSETVDVPVIPTLKGTTVIDVETEVKPIEMSVICNNSIDFSKPVTRDYSFNYPSPKHTSEVKGVGDKTGNLLDIEPINFTGMSGSIHKSIFHGILPQGLYTFSIYQENDLTSCVRNTIEIRMDGVTTYEKSSISNYHLNKGIHTLSFTVSTKNNIDIMFWANDISNDCRYSQIMLNRGSTALPYEPYGYKVPVVSMGKNLWDKNSKTTNEAGVERFGCEYPAGIYTIKNNSAYNFYWRDEGITGSKGFPPDSTQTVTANNRLIIWGGFSTDLIYVSDNPPITTPIYLPTPLMSDEVLRSDSTEETHWTKTILTGDEEIIIYHRDNTLGVYSDVISSDNTLVDVKCSHAIRDAYKYLSMTCTSNRIFWIGILTELNMTTVDEFRVWLKEQIANGTPVTIWYKISTPTTNTITVPEIPTLTGNSIIDVDTEVKPTNMSITYKKTL